MTALPSGEPSGDLVAPQLDRVVERHDRGDHPERAAHGQGQRFLTAGNGVEWKGATEDALGLFGVAAKNAGRDADFTRRLANALAVFLAEQGAELCLIGLDPPGDLFEDLIASPRRKICHRRGAGLRGLDGTRDVAFAGDGHEAKFFACGWIEYGNAVSGVGACPASVDQHVHVVASSLCKVVGH